MVVDAARHGARFATEPRGPRRDLSAAECRPWWGVLFARSRTQARLKAVQVDDDKSKAKNLDSAAGEDDGGSVWEEDETDASGAGGAGGAARSASVQRRYDETAEMLGF